MPKIPNRRQIKRNVTILRHVLNRVCTEAGWFSLKQVAAGIDRSVHVTFVPPPAKRLLEHLVQEGYVILLDRRYMVSGDLSRSFLDALRAISKESEVYLARFAAEAQ